MGGLPPHSLDLKIGAPIMLLRNINPSAGLANGTRLVVHNMQVCYIDITMYIATNKHYVF